MAAKPTIRQAFIDKWNALFPNNKLGLITEARMRQFSVDIANNFVTVDPFTAQPQQATDVRWVIMPTFSIAGNQITFSTSQILNGSITPAATQNAAIQTITFPFASAGKKRLDTLVLNYTGATPIYQRIGGQEVNEWESAAREPLPLGVLFISDIDVTDNALKPAITGVMRAIRFNKGATIWVPDANGLTDVEINLGHKILDLDLQPLPDRKNLALIGEGLELEFTDEPGTDTTTVKLTVEQPDLSAYSTTEQMNTAIGAARISYENFRFDEVSVDDSDRIDFTRRFEILEATTTGEIASVSYVIGADGTAGVVKTTITELNDWMLLNFSAGVKFFIETHQVASAGGADQGQHIFKIREV